jgi:hypothetical protein
MTFRAAWLGVVLGGIVGCKEPIVYPFRGPCPKGETCCPPGSHEEFGNFPNDIVCGPDEPPCADAEADGGSCEEAGTDAS